MTPKGIIAAILVILFLILLGQNTDVVTVRLLVWKISMSRIVLMLVSLLVGVVVGFVVARLTDSSRTRRSATHKQG
jgi:uncharacterized integral membrane protein